MKQRWSHSRPRPVVTPEDSVGTHKALPLRLATSLGVAALMLLSSCGSPPKVGTAGLKSVKPSGWALPPVAGGPSVANFCTSLRAEMAHLVTFKGTEESKGNRSYAFKQDVVDFNAAVPQVVAEAPADIAQLAGTYLHQLGEVFAVVATSKPGEKPSAKYIPPDVSKHPLSQQQINDLEGYVETNCHFQLTNPNAPVATPPGSAPPPAPGAPAPKAPEPSTPAPSVPAPSAPSHP